MGKGEMLVNSIFRFTVTTLSKINIIILATFILSYANALNLDQSIILSFGKELNELNIGNSIILFHCKN